MEILKTIGKFFGVIIETPNSVEPTTKTNSVKKRKMIVVSEFTKQGQVKKHLLEKGTITSWEAIELYGATRLSAIIFRLRDEMDIISEPNSKLDRNGNVCNFVKYKYNNGTN